MRPGMQLLLALLRGEARAEDGSETEWETVLRLAEREKILPWTAAQLRLISGAIAYGIDEQLRKIRRDAQMAAFFWSSTLRSILAEFHDREIAVVSLKGPWMAERLLGDAALRSYSDLDLLVRPEDVARSEELLFELGFRPRRCRDDHERPWYRDAVSVDLHHDVEHPLAWDFDVTRAWDRTCITPFQGVPVRLLAPADELVFLCLHSTRHRFERLGHILDLTFAFQKLPLPWAGSYLVPNPEMARLVTFASMMAARLDPRCRARRSADLSGRDHERLEQLADQVWHERTTESCPVTDWRAQHEFYLRMETRPLRRLLRRVRDVRILLTRLMEDDFVFAARFHMRRPWQVWLLRPIRLLFHASRAARSRSRPQQGGIGNYRSPEAVSFTGRTTG
ncbi:MAG TPA: nucleotidyltransferase family protein [Acidobacteriaceae bacterium]|nr:nucleotidyltransferase family protein [Acidobacteriaceae bacterium]